MGRGWTGFCPVTEKRLFAFRSRPPHGVPPPPPSPAVVGSTPVAILKSLRRCGLQFRDIFLSLKLSASFFHWWAHSRLQKNRSCFSSWFGFRSICLPHWAQLTVTGIFPLRCLHYRRLAASRGVYSSSCCCCPIFL